MKNLIFIIVSAFALFLYSCNPPQKENKKSSIDKDSNIGIPLRLAEDKEIPKDTLFSIFTDNMADSIRKYAFNKLMETNPNFSIERRLFSDYNEDMYNDPSHYYDQPCYKFLFNGKIYLFDISFDETDDILGGTERFVVSDKLDFIELHYESKKKELREDILRLYKGKYGAYNREEKVDKEYGSPFPRFIGDKKVKVADDELAYVTTKEIYTWKSRPTLRIEFVTKHNILKPFFGELNSYYYEINIFYYSKRFLAEWTEFNKKENQRIREEPIKTKSTILKDI